MAEAWPPYVSRAAVLSDLERALADHPGALDVRFYYASFLRDHGRFSEALGIFEDVLARAPDHVETLVAYGRLLALCGRRLDARAALERAVENGPAHAAALVNLANLYTLDRPERARLLYEAVLAAEPEHAAAHRGLCGLAAACGDAAAAARHRTAGYPGGPFRRRRYFGATVPPQVLALVSTDGGNIPLGALVDEREFLVHELFVEVYRGEPLPPHGAIVTAIADPDRAPAALARAAEIVAVARVPVINAPAAVAATGRVANAARLARLPGVVAPRAWPLAAASPPVDAYPLLVRAPGLHMGRGMARVFDARGLAAAREMLPRASDAVAIRYVETRSPDGAWRKYRVMAVDGRLLPLHLAIGDRWDVHYFSAPMAAHAERRAEEARFLADPVATIGPGAWAALGRVRDMLGLDYAGIDFALDGDGRIVVFEANAAMTVLPPDPDPRFTYRAPASAAIAEALRVSIRSRLTARTNNS